MCLNTLDEVIRKRNGCGYKILHEESGKTSSLIPYYRVPLPRNRWITDTGGWTSLSQSDRSYIKGFHIFLSRKDLENWRTYNGWHGYPVYRVKFRNVVASGYQFLGHRADMPRRVRVIVAKEIIIGSIIDN